MYMYACNSHLFQYERTYPIVNGTVIRKAVNNFNNYTAMENNPVYITNDAAGNVEGHNSQDPNVPFESAMLDHSTFGMGKLSTMLYWQFINAVDGVKADDLYLIKTINHRSNQTQTTGVSATGSKGIKRFFKHTA